MDVATRVCSACRASKPCAAFGYKQGLCNTCRLAKRHEANGSDWRKYFSKKLTDARQRHSDVSITPEFLIEMLVEQGGVCAMSGRKLTRGVGEMTTASIDRLENTAGYTAGNVRLVCWAVNRMRNTMGDDEFREWIIALANNPERVLGVS